MGALDDLVNALGEQDELQQRAARNDAKSAAEAPLVPPRDKWSGGKGARCETTRRVYTHHLNSELHSGASTASPTWRKEMS